MKRLILLIVTILTLTGCGNDRGSYQEERPVNTANYQQTAKLRSYRQWWDSYYVQYDGDVVFYRGFDKLEIDFYKGKIRGDVWRFDRWEINEAWTYARRELGMNRSMVYTLNSILSPSWYSTNNYNSRHKTYRSSHPVIVVEKTVVKKDKRALKKAKKLKKENAKLKKEKKKLEKDKKKLKKEKKKLEKQKKTKKKKVLKPKKKKVKKKKIKKTKKKRKSY